MDLIAIAQTIRRHKFAALPAIILTLVLGAYVMVGTTPDYEADGSYALVDPPPPPTQEQIARDPSLGKVNANNPLVDYGNLSVVGAMVSEAMETQAVERLLLADGVDPRSTAANDDLGNAPLIEVTGVGSTASEAVNSGMRMGQVLSSQLNAMQAHLGVSPGYRITLYALGVPNQATLKVTSELRDVAGVIIFGLILLWISVSIAVARAERKKGSASSNTSPVSAAREGSDGILAVNGRGEARLDGAGNGNGGRRSLPSLDLLSRSRK